MVLCCGNIISVSFVMTWSLEERLTYEREYPVKTVTEVYKELVRDGVLTSSYSVALTLLMYVVVKVFAL